MRGHCPAKHQKNPTVLKCKLSALIWRLAQRRNARVKGQVFMNFIFFFSKESTSSFELNLHMCRTENELNSEVGAVIIINRMMSYYSLGFVQ